MTKKSDAYSMALKEVSKKNADDEKAFSLLEKSLKSGNPKAAYALGTWYLHGKHVKKDVAKGIRLLNQAARKNVPDALYDFAVLCETGIGVTKNKKRAAEHYLRAALQGERQSIYEVGRCYYHGIGFKKDRRLAWIWLDRAKELGIRGKEKSTKNRRPK